MKTIFSLFLLFIFLTPLACAQTVSIGDHQIALDSEFAVPININDAELIAGGVVNVSFNPSIIHLEIVTAGDFGSPFANINNTNGWVKLVAARIDKVNKSQAVLANLVFNGSTIGLTGVNFTYAILNNASGEIFTPTIKNGTIEVVLSLDETPLSSITDLRSTVGDTWINWTWTNPVDADFNHTIIYLDGAIVAEFTENHFNATGLQPATIHTIGTHTADINGMINQAWVNNTALTAGDLTISVGQDAPDLATQNHFIAAYNRNGGIIVLGSPATVVHRAWGYLVQDFPGASGYGGGIIIYNTYQKYAYYIHSEIWERYYSMGGANAKTNLNFWLGPPTSDIEPYVHQLPPEKSKYGTPFRYQKFEGGNLELNITSGKVFEVHGGILQKWRELGYAASNLGLPTTDEREAAKSPSGLTGRYSVFEGGIIHWIRETNEIFVIGLNQPEGKKIADKYYAEGGSGGWLGFPVSNDYVNNFGYLQVNCEGGYITTLDGINFVTYPKDVTRGPTIKIEIPQTNFHTADQKIRLSGIAVSDGLITRIDAMVKSSNGNPTFYRIPYDYKTTKWETNVGLQYGLNIINVSVADGNFHGSRDTIYVYYDEPDFSFVHMTDVHIGDITLPLSNIKKSRITNVLDQINKEIPKPDFVLISGDLVDYSNEDFFNQFNDIFTSVKAYIVPGNHDRRLWPAIGGNDNLVNYRKNIDKSQNLHYINDIYNFEERGYQFIGLDSGSDYDYLYPSLDTYYMNDFSPEGTGLTDTQLSGLMEFDKTTPKIIFMHNPAIDNSDDKKPIQCYLYPLTPEICKPALIPNINYGGNDETIANNREEFIDYTIEYNVQLVLSGHTHENYIFNSHGTKLDVLSEDRPLFIQTGSAMGNEYKDESDGLSFSNRPPLYGYRIIDLRDGKVYPRQFRPMEPLLAPNTDLMPLFESTDRSKLTLELRCPANLHVYDSQGRHTGLNSSGGIETNIPESFYIGRYNASDPDEPETIFIYNATEEYSFEIIANLTEEQKNSPENESFNFTMDRQSEGIRTIESFQNITLNENTIATLHVNITTENPKMSLDYNGDTITDETKYPNSIETNYAPTAAIITPEIGSIYNESEIIEFNGTGRDPEDGILTNTSLVWYSDIDGFIGSGERFGTVNLSAGSHIITLMVNDSMYLYGASSMTITIADTAPPVTTLIPSGTLGNNSWFISEVNVTLTATDTQTGSGVNITEYSFDNATWTTYLTHFNITSEGITTVYFRSTDNIGNVESINNQTIKIDKTLPYSIVNPQTIIGSTWLNLTWLNPPDPDFNHTILYLNGTHITDIPAPQNYYNFTGLEQDTLYELGTHTVDSSGNVNQTWVNKTARTAPLSGLLSSTISLKSGWNLISVPFDLTTWKLGDESDVGKPINVTPTNCISSLYQYNTTSALFEKSDHFTDWGWWPATGSESFTALEPGRGYWIMAQQDCSLTFTGTAPSDLDIPLDTGWNLVGWYSMNVAPLDEEAEAGNPLNVTPANSLTSIYRYNTTSALFEKSDHFPDWGWWPATGSEGFTEIEPGRGYWVMAQNGAEWRHRS
ncbi:MAG: metallophosphoesterase [Candidatus Methanoperedens sp.]|nr:metallophosphoesterase [Candidatus Methanoperedens sp.]